MDLSNLLELLNFGLRGRSEIEKLRRKIQELTDPSDKVERITELVKLAVEEINPNRKPYLWYRLDKALFKILGAPEVNEYQTWTAKQIRDAVTETSPIVLSWNPPKDGKYRVISVKQAKRIVASSFAVYRDYLADLRDCDDYAAELRYHFERYLVNSCLEVWGYLPSGTYHSWNWVVCHDGVLEVEPQNGKNAVLSDGGLGYRPEKIHDW
jgi:hypothetical protein